MHRRVLSVVMERADYRRYLMAIATGVAAGIRREQGKVLSPPF